MGKKNRNKEPKAREVTLVTFKDFVEAQVGLNKAVRELQENARTLGFDVGRIYSAAAALDALKADGKETGRRMVRDDGMAEAFEETFGAAMANGEAL